MSRDELRRTLRRDEGTGPMKNGRYMPYTDTVGKLTIGIGRNLTDRGVSILEGDLLFENDIDDTVKALVVRYPWVETLNPARQGVLVNMSYNMGVTGLAGFKRGLRFAQDGDIDRAGVEWLSSRWAEQVGERAIRLAEQWRSGVWV